jgi:hypothetical protein
MPENNIEFRYGIAITPAAPCISMRRAQSPAPATAPSQRDFANFNAKLPKQPHPTNDKLNFKENKAYENSPGVREALATIDAGTSAVLITGRAGTGKTTLIKYLRDRPGGEKTAVVAPTAVAALNNNAQTIHSFFRLPPRLLDAKDLPQGGSFGKLFRRMNRLIIDEVSMVRVDLVDSIDARLRLIRNDPRPFGGVQVVMVGDFLQLPPVVEDIGSACRSLTRRGRVRESPDIVRTLERAT